MILDIWNYKYNCSQKESKLHVFFLHSFQSITSQWLTTLWSWPADHMFTCLHDHVLTITSDMWPSYYICGFIFAFFSRVAGRGDGCGTCYMALPQMSQAGLLFAYISLQASRDLHKSSACSITFSLTLWQPLIKRYRKICWCHFLIAVTLMTTQTFKIGLFF